jgi:hypothetical protein
VGGKARPHRSVKLCLRSMIRCSLLSTTTIMLGKLCVEFFLMLRTINDSAIDLGKQQAGEGRLDLLRRTSLLLSDDAIFDRHTTRSNEEIVNNMSNEYF